MISVSVSSKSENKFINSLTRILKPINEKVLHEYGKKGVELLKQGTPKDSSKTSESWFYKIERENGNYSLSFYNDNKNDGANIAILLQYGHATRGGTYVKGIDYINPTIQPLFNEMSDKLWREVTR